jgi:hypothetical protein
MPGNGAPAGGEAGITIYYNRIQKIAITGLTVFFRSLYVKGRGT